MKRKIVSMAIVGASLIGWSSVTRGQGLYFDANVGPSLADDVSVKQFIAPGQRGDIELDPGMRLSVAGGYNFNRYLGVQLESGFIYNNIDKIGRNSADHAALTHVPILADVVFRCEKGNIVPYIGVGAGGDVSAISFDEARVGAARLDGTSADVVFAWQAFAGARYKINETMSIGGGYKYFWADGASWDVRRSAQDIETKDAGVHSLGVDFNMKF
ncbi:MAG TPA: outer membrane beta-barrel protein [Candidatus Acidoferrum sp.]|nr:outer membrane beta-barrel protein [Candidatus Acidoferrum sp.]